MFCPDSRCWQNHEKAYSMKLVLYILNIPEFGDKFFLKSDEIKECIQPV